MHKAHGVGGESLRVAVKESEEQASRGYGCEGTYRVLFSQVCVSGEK